MNIRTAWKRYVLAPVIIASIIMAADLAKAQSVYWNPANSVGAGHEAAIKQAVWSWGQRTGMAVTYAGITDAGECEPNAITYRTATEAEWQVAGAAAGFSQFEFQDFLGFAFTCPYGGYTLLLSPRHNASASTIAHELGHGLRGYGHLNVTSGALMLPASAGVTVVTQADADLVLASPDWPLINAPSYCHAELQDNYTLHVPEIAGTRVTLKYAGQQNGYMGWTIQGQYTNHTSKGCSTAVMSQNGTVAELFDVRSRSAGNLTYARIRWVNGVWRLEAAR